MLRLFSRLFVLPVILISALTTGCDSIPKDLAGLEVDIIGVRSFNTTPSGHELVVTARCRNETVRPIGIREVRIDLVINGIALGKASSNKPIATQALSTNTGDITFQLDDASLAERLATNFDRGSVNYEIRTQLEIVSGGQRLRSKSSSSGAIDVSHLKRN